MKFLKKFLALTMVFACVLGFSGCGDKDLRIFAKDITAIVDGQEQSLFYYEWDKEHEPGESDLLVHDGADSIYFALKDQAKTISKTSHEVTVTFAEVKPKFREEDIRFMAIGRDIGSNPDNQLSYGDVPITLPITHFQSKKGKLSFQFEIDKLFAKGTVMFCIAIWYDYDSHNVFIPMNISAEQVGDHEINFHDDKLWNTTRERPNYLD